MILVMVLFQFLLILLEKLRITVATLGIDDLDIRIEHVSFQEHGVEHSQDVSVSY